MKADRECYVIVDGHGHFEGLVFLDDKDATKHCLKYNKTIKFPTMGGSHGIVRGKLIQNRKL